MRGGIYQILCGICPCGSPFSGRPVRNTPRSCQCGDSSGPEIQKADIPVMAKHADQEGNPLYPIPVLMNRKELEIIYRKVKGQETES